MYPFEHGCAERASVQIDTTQSQVITHDLPSSTLLCFNALDIVWLDIGKDKSELLRPILWNFEESYLGYTSGICFDNVTLRLHNVTLMSK